LVLVASRPSDYLTLLFRLQKLVDALLEYGTDVNYVNNEQVV